MSSACIHPSFLKISIVVPLPSPPRNDNSEETLPSMHASNPDSMGKETPRRSPARPPGIRHFRCDIRGNVISGVLPLVISANCPEYQIPNCLKYLGLLLLMRNFSAPGTGLVPVEPVMQRLCDDDDYYFISGNRKTECKFRANPTFLAEQSAMPYTSNTPVVCALF